MAECRECGDEYTLDDGCDDDGMCHDCAHAIAEGRISSMVSARDITIRDLRAEIENVLRNGSAAERARLAQKMLVEYPRNRHAHEWADWILRQSSEQETGA